MHYVTIAVLVVVAVVESIDYGFPVNVIVAVLTASVLDVAIKMLWLKRKLTIPLSAIITGLIIGSVSVNAPPAGVFIAAVLAILSKFFIRFKGSHIFNPALFGVVITQIFSPAAHGPVAHGSSQVIEGFGPGGFIVNIWLVPLLLLASWRARKLWISIPYLFATALFFNFTGLSSLNSLNIRDIFKFLEILPYYYAFIMVSEPKTTPYFKKEQVIFGIGIATLSVLPLFIFDFYNHVVALVALLLGNIIYTVYRVATTGTSYTENLRNKKIILVIVGMVVALVALYFGVNWLTDQIPSHVPIKHDV